MSNHDCLFLTTDQLLQLLNQFYLPYISNHDEISQILTKWIQSPSSIPLSFEIIRSSENEKLRFIAACSFHYIILEDITVFTQENLTEMLNLFISQVTSNQNRIDSPDTKYILISLADICGIFTNFLEKVYQLLSPEIFLILIALLTEEITNSKFHKYNENCQVNTYLEQKQDLIYQLFSSTPFNLNWSQSFCKIYDFYCKTTNLLPFLDRISMMMQEETYFQCFLSIFYRSFLLHFDDDESSFIFITSITKMAVSFANDQPDYACDIWSTILDYSRRFFLNADRIEFNESLFQSFFENIPNFYEESETFCKVLQNFTNLISSVNDDVDFYPDELRAKSILTFVSLLIHLYDQKSIQTIGCYIEKAVNRLAKTRFCDIVKQFVISQPLSSAIFLMLRTNLFSENDFEFFIQILNQMFTFSEIPIESIQFIRSKLLKTEVVIPYIGQLIHFLMGTIGKHPDASIQTLKELSECHPSELTIFSHDMSQSLLPLLPHFSLDNQQRLIQLFFNIFTTDDQAKLETIKDQILLNCESAIESSDLTKVKKVIVFLSNLYHDLSTIENQLIIDFMTKLLPSVFHVLLAVATVPDFDLQDTLSQLIQNASLKCIIFPQTDDPQQRQKILIEGEMYGEIFQWLFTMMNHYLCDLHFTVLMSFQIRPFNDILKIISQIGPNDNAQIIEEMLDYISSCFSGNSDELWSLIPPQFFIVFLDSPQLTVAALILHFFRMLQINSEEVKSMILNAIISKTTNDQWYSNNSLLFDSIKTVAVFINQNKNIFDLYIQLMNSAFPKIPQNYYFKELWRLSQENLDVIEEMKFSPRSDYIKGELQDIIFMNM